MSLSPLSNSFCNLQSSFSFLLFCRLKSLFLSRGGLALCTVRVCYEFAPPEVSAHLHQLVTKGIPTIFTAEAACIFKEGRRHNKGKHKEKNVKGTRYHYKMSNRAICSLCAQLLNAFIARMCIVCTAHRRKI